MLPVLGLQGVGHCAVVMVGFGRVHCQSTVGRCSWRPMVECTGLRLGEMWWEMRWITNMERDHNYTCIGRTAFVHRTLTAIDSMIPVDMISHCCLERAIVMNTKVKRFLEFAALSPCFPP